MLLLELLPLGARLFHAPNLVRTDGTLPHEVHLQGITYRRDVESTEAEGFIGFFDWLRTEPDTVVGVCLFPFSYLPYLSLLQRYSYARLCYQDQGMEILFGSDQHDPGLSGDQDFTLNYVYRYADQLLLTFPVDHFTEPEWAGVLTLCQQFEK